MKKIILLLSLLCLGRVESTTTLKSPPQENLKEIGQRIDSEEYVDDSEEEDTDYVYYDEEDEQEVENSVDLELEEPNMSSNDTSRIFRLRQKRRRRRKPRRGRKPWRGRGRRQRRPPPLLRPFGYGGKLKSPKPTEESEEQPVKHGNLINYAEPIGPFYSETSHIPLPETPVLLAIYPKKRKSRSGSPERKLEFRTEAPPTVRPTTTTTTRKPDVIHHYHHSSTNAPQPLQQTFNIALPQMQVQPQPIVIQQQGSPTKAPSQTKISVSAFVKEIQPRPLQHSASWTTPRPVYGAPAASPNYQYGTPNSAAIRRCATWTPFFYKNLRENRGSHYFGRRIDSVDDQKSCQYQNSASNSINKNSWQVPWSSSSSNYGAPAPVKQIGPAYSNNFNQASVSNNPNVVSTITKYYPTAHFQNPVTTSTSTSTFQITPSQAYEISQNLYESFKQKLLQEQQQQQLSVNGGQPLPFADTTQSGISNSASTFINDLPNNVNNEAEVQSQGQSQGSPDFEQQSAVSVPITQNLKPPKESYNYLTFQNNQLPSEDYEFPVSEEQVEEFNLPPKKKKKRIPVKNKTKVKQKKKKKEKFQIETSKLVPDIFNAVKSDLDAVPIRIFNNLFPKIFVSKTKNGGKDIEFTIGK